jgi:hypothetical protein
VLFLSFPTPVTEAVVVGGTLGDNGWHTTPVTLQLRPDLPSVDRYWYLEGDPQWGAPQLNPPERGKDTREPDERWVDHWGQPLMIDRSGAHVLKYASRMTAGATVPADRPPHVPEAWKALDLRIDTDAPLPSKLVADPPFPVPVGTKVKLHVTCADPTSGIVRFQVAIRLEGDPGGEPNGPHWRKLEMVAGSQGVVEWDTTGWTPAQYHIHVDCWDKAGHQGCWPCFANCQLLPAERRPDALARKAATGPFVGNDVYEGTPMTQVLSCSRARGKTAKYYLRLENDGNLDDQLRLKGTAGGAAWTVKYSRGWTTPKDITTAVAAGTWQSRALAPGRGVQVLVEVTPRTSGAQGTTKSLVVTVSSAIQPTRKDAFKLATSCPDAASDATATVASVLASLSAAPTAAGAQVSFSLASAATVEAHVLNLAGRPVRTLCQGKTFDAGTNTLLWNARSDQGLPVPGGSYLIEVTARGADGSQSRALATVRINR